ncbi:MAG: YfaZ family outer membrane protein [Campylobacterota bacterium]|nr:YfaZ family outer membrane protein [Campylobacterota bacterium]
MKKILYSSLFATTLLLGQNEFKLNINNKTLEIAGDVYLNNLYNLNNYTNYYFTASYMKTQTEDEDISNRLSTVGFKITNSRMNSWGLSFGMGMKAIYSSIEDTDLMAMPLGLHIQYEPNEMFFFALEGYYSPQVLTFMDATNYKSGEFSINYRILRDGYIYAGFRKIIAETENSNKEIEFDDNPFFGFRVRF